MKNEFWLYLKRMNDVIDMSWCIMGDFNEMLQTINKIGATNF